MAIRITEDGVVNYENSPDVNRKLFPNLNICGKEIEELAEEIDGKAPAVFSTASGSTASFDNGADDMSLKSCVVSFGPIQEGSGDPSLENVRPISGRTGLSVVRYGKNLLPMPIVSGSYDYTTIITVNDDKSFVINKTNGTGWSIFILGSFTLKPGTYTLIESDDASTNAQLVLDKVIGDTTELLITTRYAKRNVFTIEADTLVQARYVRAGIADNVLTKLMLFVGNAAAATDYEPYKGSTYSVNWESEVGTVYGGHLDVVSGVLTVDYFKYSPLSSYTPSQFTSLGTYTRVAYSDVAVKPGVNASAPYTGVYSHGSYDNRAWAGDYSHAFCTDLGIGYFYLPCEATAEAIQAYLKSQEDAGTPVTVAYKIATPIEYQLIPQEVRTLLGENNILSEDGDVSVEYPVDTKTYIDDLSIKTVEVSGQTPTITAEENTRYICKEVTSLSFTPCEKGICDVRFTAASISTVLTLPETVKLPEWFDPTLLEAGTTYEINVLDGIYGVVMAWA